MPSDRLSDAVKRRILLDMGPVDSQDHLTFASHQSYEMLAFCDRVYPCRHETLERGSWNADPPETTSGPTEADARIPLLRNSREGEDDRKVDNISEEEARDGEHQMNPGIVGSVTCDEGDHVDEMRNRRRIRP